MTQSIAESFIDQLEQAAAGGDVNLIPFEEEKVEDTPVDVVEPLVLQEKGIYTGSVENAMTELSTLFESAFDVSLKEEEEPEPVIEEPTIIPEVVEVLTEETTPEPTIAPEAIEAATSDLKDLFEVIAGIDLSTGAKIEPPKLEPVRYDIMDDVSTILNGSRPDNTVVSFPKQNGANEFERKEVASKMLTKDWAPTLENTKASQVITDVTSLLEKHRGEMAEEEYKLLESDAVEKTVEYINDHVELSEEEYTNSQSMPFTGANMPLVSNTQFTFAVGNILRKMMATGPGTGIVELTKLDDVDATNISATHQFLAWDASKSQFVAAEGTTPVGDISGVVAGTGLSGGGTTGTVTINLDPVTVALGGTGITAAAKGSVLIANAADTFSALSGTTDGDVLTYNSGTDTISWSGSVDGGTY